MPTDETTSLLCNDVGDSSQLERTYNSGLNGTGPIVVDGAPDGEPYVQGPPPIKMAAIVSCALFLYLSRG